MHKFGLSLLVVISSNHFFLEVDFCEYNNVQGMPLVLIFHKAMIAIAILDSLGMDLIAKVVLLLSLSLSVFLLMHVIEIDECATNP